MARNILSKFLLAAAVLSSANAYFLFAMNDVITTERIDPIVNPGKVSGHVHTIMGGSNFRVTTNTSYLRQSECTSSPIKEDKSNYWAPTLYFQSKNGSFTSVTGSPVIYYLFSDTAGLTTPFPDDFRMLSGTPTLRSYNASSYAQQAITFLCLDFSGTTTKHNEIPTGVCPSGIRAQINFPSCWDGKNTDSTDHKSHVTFPSGGPDSGTCSDPNFPKTLPRVFMEMYLDTASFDASQAMNPSQPFVYSMGDPTGYGYHADFIMGWDKGILDQVVNKCQCTSAAFGDPTCCSTAGFFTFTQGGTCRITKGVDEITTGTLPALPGNNPVVPLNGVATNLVAPVTPALISPVYAYTGDSPTQTGEPVGSPVTVTGGGAASSSPAVGSTTTPAAASSTAKAASSTAKASSTKGAGTTDKGATSTSVPASAPSSGSGSPGGSGSGSGSNSGSGSSGSGSGSGSGPSGSPSQGSGSSSGSNSGSGSSGSPSQGSGSNPPANGAGSSSPSTGSGTSSGTPAKGSSSSSGSNSTCNKKTSHSKRAAARRARDFHESSRRRFATPEQRFVEDDF